MATFKNLLHAKRRIYCDKIFSKHVGVNSRDGRWLTYSVLQHAWRSIRKYSSDAHDEDAKLDIAKSRHKSVAAGPGLEHFLANPPQIINSNTKDGHIHRPSTLPYVKKEAVGGFGRNVYFETYGCQMNVNDTEVAWSILADNGFNKTLSIDQADVILVMTCAIRDGAEQKIWKRLEFLKSIKKKRERATRNPVKIGILGCMAERLKHKIVEQEKMVDVVCGPDAYRDLPRMLAQTQPGQAAVNVLLSLDETYANVMPVRLNAGSTSAFVSIMRGCDNMCSYCIVPFTRGRERSRPITSILQEVKQLSHQGIKEVTLLGQNVNSYRDVSEVPSFGGFDTKEPTHQTRGFRTIYKPKLGGRRFADLLQRVADIDPEMRIRFTSPHPKDFPDEVLELINSYPNICNQLHLPAQSGSTEVLAAMRRGYTREAYIELCQRVRAVIPDVALSSDFIAGFCGETEDAHRDTVSLLRLIKYNFVYSFPYSMRQKTHASHRLTDDVEEEVKKARHEELCRVWREEAANINLSQSGKVQLVLVEGDSKRSAEAVAGRNDANTKIIVPKLDIPAGEDSSVLSPIRPGDYIAVKVTDGNSQVLKGVPLYHSKIQDFSQTSLPYSVSSEVKAGVTHC